MANKPVLAVTTGEPAGIGPDLVVLSADAIRKARVVVIGDPELLRSRAKLLGQQVEVRELDWSRPGEQTFEEQAIPVWPVPLKETAPAGQLRQANSVYVLDCLRAAVESWRQGLADGMVTAPVHKGIINEAGHSFSGHTEYFARAGHVSRVVMMLVARRLRVALVTTHIPISHVPRAVTQPAIESACRITEEALRLDFGISAPKLAVCGLNPHAGESGHMGDEEIRVIQPALERLKEQNQLSVSGPWPADTIFAPQRAAEYDAVIAMYHDQGLAPLKAIGFGQAVNVTLGLPFIRTSVDHGTALNLAGTGQADNSSFIEALNLAQQLAIRRIG